MRLRDAWRSGAECGIRNERITSRAWIRHCIGEELIGRNVILKHCAGWLCGFLRHRFGSVRLLPATRCDTKDTKTEDTDSKTADENELWFLI
jgi:hypothetical protein